MKDAFMAMLNVVTFRASQDQILALGQRDLALGLFTTWIVGMGRYWDDPGAKLAQHLGLGSLIYVCALSLVLWLLYFPWRIPGWSYTRILTFVSLTSLPAIFYAIPVERFYSIDTSAQINAIFLLVVASWRVALLVFFFRRGMNLGRFQTGVATLLPLTGIVVMLSTLNLERAAFNIMGGIREKTSHDIAYQVLFMLSLISMALIAPLLIAYISVCSVRWRARKT
jgi:hypothetical protein